jgi:SAM-dependent methyltransferase
MSRYIFDQNEEDRELGRLRMIEAACDAETIGLLEQTGVTMGWTCLELGAGAGSVVEWMGARVGSKGHVMAVDKNTAHLGRFSSSPYRVVQGDFLSLSLDPTLDLLHARYVLIHNKNDEGILKKVRTLVKPGGFVVLEEPDFTSARFLNSNADDACRRVNEAICRMFADAGLDPGYGIHLPREMERAGMKIVATKATMHLCHGRAPIAKVMAESALALRKQYTGTGITTDQDIDRYVELAQDPQHWSVYYMTVSVVAQMI